MNDMMIRSDFTCRPALSVRSFGNFSVLGVSISVEPQTQDADDFLLGVRSKPLLGPCRLPLDLLRSPNRGRSRISGGPVRGRLPGGWARCLQGSSYGSIRIEPGRSIRQQSAVTPCGGATDGAILGVFLTLMYFSSLRAHACPVIL